MISVEKQLQLVKTLMDTAHVIAEVLETPLATPTPEEKELWTTMVLLSIMLHITIIVERLRLLDLQMNTPTRGETEQLDCLADELIQLIQSRAQEMGIVLSEKWR